MGPGLGLELVSSVNNIPKGSRLAVSTNLLAALIAVCMRATGQSASLRGPLTEPERRLVAAWADPSPVFVPVLMRELGNSPRGVSEGGA